LGFNPIGSSNPINPITKGGISVKDEKKEKASEEELAEAKNLFVEGLGKIVWATGRITKKVIEGFNKGYREENNKKDDRREEEKEK
jgi:hypothetical protein